MALLNIAFRNIKEHKVKTYIIGIIISIGITILVVGNSMMDTAALGIKTNYINNYTGDLIVMADTDTNLTLFGAMDINSMTETLPVIPHYFEIRDYALSNPDVLRVSGQAAGRARMEFGENIESFGLLFGVEPEAYLKMFPNNIDLLEGELLSPGEQGILISKRIADQIMDEYDVAIKSGNTVLLTGFSSGGGAKIRELTIQGIFQFKNSNPHLDMVSLIDIDSLRSLNGMTLGAELAVKTTDEEIDLIEDFDEQELFGESDDLLSDGMILENKAERSRSEDDLLSILGDTKERELLAQTDSGAWHFMLLKVRPGANSDRVKMDFNRFFKEKDILAKIEGWKSGAGPMGEMADTLKTVFNIIIFIIAVVAIIIIMNTLVISITERISEIGTMRALGAQKGFIRKMIISETIIISTLFGLMGIVLGIIILLALGATGITAPNMFFEIIFGGKVLYPVISMATIIQSLVIIVLIGIISSLYPVSIALKIQPLRAIHAQ